MLPATLQSVTQMNLDLEWTYGVGNEPAGTTDAQALAGVGLNGNVAIDMFIDSDKSSAQDSNKAKYEVMVWFADFGPAAQPIGQEKGVAATQVVNGTTLFVFSITLPFPLPFGCEYIRIRAFVRFRELTSPQLPVFWPERPRPERLDMALDRHDRILHGRYLSSGHQTVHAKSR